MTQVNRWLVWIAVACLLTLAPASAADKWLHVHVEEDGERGETVKINVPLSVVETMLPLIEVDDLQRGKVRLDDDDLEGIDLRELATALRDTPDADFVTVESEDETVRVAKEGDFLIVHVDERDGHSGETVRVRMPLAVVDALLGGGTNELDLVAALEALGAYEGEALVDIRSDDSSVRIWIDSSDSVSGR
jgi:hypothetical protein